MDVQLVYPKKAFLNGIDYVPWSIRIEAYMQVVELGIRSVVHNGYKNPKKMNAILNGL